MSGAGSPGEKVTGFTGKRVVIVASSWHEVVMDGLIAGAKRVVESVGVTPEIYRVPGTFELPIAALAAAKSGADVVIALGVVIRGGTPHFDFVCNAAKDGLLRAQLDTGVPIGFGVLTCDNEKQALAACATTTVGPTDEEDRVLRSMRAVARFEHAPTLTA